MPSLSIVCIDTLNHLQAAQSVLVTYRCLSQIPINVEKVHWVSNLKFPLDLPVACSHHVISPIKQFPLDYNIHALQLLPEIMQEDFCLIVQHDGMATNPDAWTNDFFTYDFIGAKSWKFLTPPVVGNGGFSMRSQKLMQAIKNINIPPSHDNDGEDAQICRYYRPDLEQKFGIKFAPGHVADRFSMEMPVDPDQKHWLGKSLGFHGKTNIDKFYAKL